ncbi:Hypothetical predicted protein [Paramuricea clavata]|uniref:Uncharacterized protein n=1 Tax=Paramuricea clavata TaxID=317549 RepID=A0A7D9DAX7_PARCT|nr:Hypothetical predicted protein [Paramuricea clavata]
MLLLYIFAILICICNIDAVGEESGNTENSSMSNIPSFTCDINNLFLYELWKKKDKEDSASATVLSTVIKLAFKHSGITHVQINDRILHAFHKKLYLLKKAYLKANRLGGKCLKRLLGKWNTGDPYRFKIYYHEVDKLNLKNETLRIEKWKLNVETNEYEVFDLINDEELSFTKTEPQELSDNDMDNVNMWLYLKDKFNISNEAWA